MAKTKATTNQKIGLTKSTLNIALKNWRLFGGLSLAYVIINWLVTGWPAQAGFTTLKNNLANLSQQGIGGLGAVLNSLSSLTGSASAFGGLLLLVLVLAVVFAARQIEANTRPTIREVIYIAPAPLVSTSLVLVFMALSLVPATLGSALFGFVTYQGGFPVLAIILSAILALLLWCLSVFWLLRLLIAFYIAALPGKYPLKAIAEARSVVSGKRYIIIKKLLGFVALIIIGWAIILAPFLALALWHSSLTAFLLAFISNLAQAAAISLLTLFGYKLYRSMI